MDKEEEYFQRIAEKLSKEHRLVKIGKMMSAPGISYKKKFFAFYYKKEITKAPMKNWYQMSYSESKNWGKLAKLALKFLSNELK